MKTREKLYWSIIFVGAVAYGCGEAANNHDHGHNHEHEHTAEPHASPAEDACEHVEEGPFEGLDAVEPGGEPASIAASHTRYDIILPGNPPEGQVVFENSMSGESHFYFGTDVDLTVTDADGAEVTATGSVDPVTDCEQVREGFVYDLEVGAYTLTIAGAPEVSMVYVPAEEFE